MIVEVVGELWGGGMMGCTIFWGSSQEGEDREEILNITLGKGQKKTLFIYLQFHCGTMRCSPEPLHVPQVGGHSKEEVRERLLWSSSFQWERFQSVGIMIQNTVLMCMGKEKWVN